MRLTEKGLATDFQRLPALMSAGQKIRPSETSSLITVFLAYCAKTLH